MDPGFQEFLLTKRDTGMAIPLFVIRNLFRRFLCLSRMVVTSAVFFMVGINPSLILTLGWLLFSTSFFSKSGFHDGLYRYQKKLRETIFPVPVRYDDPGYHILRT